MLVKFQTGFGDPRPQPIWFFWPISIRTKILAPESALGAKHFKSCVILGHPNSAVFNKEKSFCKLSHACISANLLSFPLCSLQVLFAISYFLGTSSNPNAERVD